MNATMTMDELMKLKGQTVYSSDGEKIGEVEDVYYDESTREPHWLGIGTGFFGSKHILVPVRGAARDNDGLRVSYTKERVQDAPVIDADELSEDQELQLTRYYEGGGRYEATGGMADTTRGMDAGRTAQAEGSVTRSEEELRVGTREVEAGRVRLRKWVETQPVEADVTLHRETARIEREPINQPVSGAEIGEQEVELRLTEEEAVVSKDTVAKERISLSKEVVAEEQTIRDEVRQERVEVEGAEERDRR